MSDLQSLETAIGPPKHPSDDLIREWAAKAIGVEQGASNEACSRRFVELLRDNDGSVEPPIADSFRLLNSRDKEHFSANLERIHPSTRGAIGRFLLQKVEAFAAASPSLTPTERREEWEKLSPAADFDPFAKVRLEQLKSFLNFPEHRDCVDESDSRWLSQRILEIVVRPATEQNAEWNRLVHKLERTPKTTEAMARKLMESLPELTEATLPWLTKLANISTYEKQQTKRVAKFVRSNVGALVGRGSRSLARHVFKGSGQQTQSTGNNWGWLVIVAIIGVFNASRSCNQTNEYASRATRVGSNPFEKLREAGGQQNNSIVSKPDDWPTNLADMYFEKDRAKSTLYRLRNRKLFDSFDKITNAWEAVIRIEGLGAFEGLEQKLNSEIAAYRSESTNAASTAEQRESNRKKLAAHEALMEVFRRWRDERQKQQAADAAASTTEKAPTFDSNSQSFLDSLPKSNGSTTTEAKP